MFYMVCVTKRCCQLHATEILTDCMLATWLICCAITTAYSLSLINNYPITLCESERTIKQLLLLFKTTSTLIIL